MKDLAPIDQQWVQKYVDVLLSLVDKGKPDAPLSQAAMLRAQHAMDLVEAWQKRNEPRT